MNEYKGGSAINRHFAVANGTALHWAVFYGKLEIAQLLLDKGAGMPSSYVQSTSVTAPNTKTVICCNSNMIIM